LVGAFKDNGSPYAICERRSSSPCVKRRVLRRRPSLTATSRGVWVVAYLGRYEPSRVVRGGRRARLRLEPLAGVGWDVFAVCGVGRLWRTLWNRKQARGHR
jgi:hypothetical protein